MNTTAKATAHTGWQAAIAASAQQVGDAHFPSVMADLGLQGPAGVVALTAIVAAALAALKGLWLNRRGGLTSDELHQIYADSKAAYEDAQTVTPNGRDG